VIIIAIVLVVAIVIGPTQTGKTTGFAIPGMTRVGEGGDVAQDEWGAVLSPSLRGKIPDKGGNP
jgi:hypothetical protein